MWHLKPPTCPLLTKLKQLDTKVEVEDLSKCVIALGEFSTLNSNLKSNNSAVAVSIRELIHCVVFPSHLLEEKKIGYLLL